MSWEALEYPDGVKAVKIPGVAKKWQMWQWAGDVVGLHKNGMDLNFFNGTWQEMYGWLGFTPRNATPVHTCPVGQHWDDAAGGCVADVVTPPVDDSEALKKIAALDVRVSELERWRRS